MSAYLFSLTLFPLSSLLSLFLSTAPTNDAFDALPEGTLDSLLLPENVDTLTDILTYHVVEGIVHSTAITGDVNVTALNGDDIMVTTADGVKVNGANVIATNVLASNGIIHVIDAVILPPSDDAGASTTTAAPGEGATTTTAAAGGEGSTTTTTPDEMVTTEVPTTEAPAIDGDGDSAAVSRNIIGSLALALAAGAVSLVW